MQSLWMLVASFLFSIMGVCVKLAGDHYSTAEIAFIYALIYIKGGTLKTPYPRDHLIRGA